MRINNNNIITVNFVVARRRRRRTVTGAGARGVNSWPSPPIVYIPLRARSKIIIIYNNFIVLPGLSGRGARGFSARFAIRQRRTNYIIFFTYYKTIKCLNRMHTVVAKCRSYTRVREGVMEMKILNPLTITVCTGDEKKGTIRIIINKKKYYKNECLPEVH